MDGGGLVFWGATTRRPEYIDIWMRRDCWKKHKKKSQARRRPKLFLSRKVLSEEKKANTGGLHVLEDDDVDCKRRYNTRDVRRRLDRKNCIVVCRLQQQ